MIPEFFGILYMVHGPGSMDCSRILWISVYGAWAKVYGWLQNSVGFCTCGMGQGLWDGSRILWNPVHGGMGQGLWMAPEFFRILYMGHGPGSMAGSRILWNPVHGAWARVYGWLQNSLEFCICCMSQGLWVALEFFGILHMGHGPGSLDGSTILWEIVHGACAKVY